MRENGRSQSFRTINFSIEYSHDVLTSNDGEFTMKFTVVLTEDPEAPGVFNASVPAIPGCLSWGHTRTEAYKNIMEALEGCLAVLREDGDPVPMEVGRKTVRMK
jgi:antitoxin HicB